MKKPFIDYYGTHAKPYNCQRMKLADWRWLHRKGMEKLNSGGADRGLPHILILAHAGQGMGRKAIHRLLGCSYEAVNKTITEFGGFVHEQEALDPRKCHGGSRLSDIDLHGRLEREHGRWWVSAYAPSQMDRYYADLENYRRRSRESAKRRYYKLRHTPEYKAKQSARNAVGRIIRWIGGEWKHSHRTQDLLGCTYAECARHIEGQFKHGMRWSNHGRIWEIDHIIPLSDWELTDLQQLRQACNYLNLRPLHKNLNRPGIYPVAPAFSQLNLGIGA